MFHEKLKTYRKKNLWTQEELAEKLHVSRQIVTKWESGLVMPGLEYLIDLSQLFGVTIDSLVKDDDCAYTNAERKDARDLQELHYFLVEAKGKTYAAKKGQTEPSRPGALDYAYANGKYSYRDSFVGSSKFAGEEVVYENGGAVWSMNYYGRVTGECFDGDFLKEALLRVPAAKPFRGPESYTRGDFHYHCAVSGDLSFFHGREEIFYRDEKVYECLVHGGILEA